MKRGDLVTANTRGGIGVGNIHTTPCGALGHFAQVRITSFPQSTLLNVYLLPEDEGKTWIAGHDVEKLGALLVSEALK